MCLLSKWGSSQESFRSEPSCSVCSCIMERREKLTSESLPIQIHSYTYRFGQVMDQQLPNSCIHTVHFGLHTYTGQQAEVIPHQATCNLNSPDWTQICFWYWHTNNLCEVSGVYWGPVPFWRVVMIKIGNVLGWRAALGEGGRIYRSKGWYII